MRQDLTIAVKIALQDAGRVSRDLEGVARQIKPIKVKLEANEESLRSGKVRLEGTEEFASAGRSVAEGMGQRVSEAIESSQIRVDENSIRSVVNVLKKGLIDGIEDSLDGIFEKASKGNVLGAIAGVASAPFQIASSVAGAALSLPFKAIGAVGSGLIDGITDELVRGIGVGLRKATEARFAGTFGSGELLGRTAASGLIDRLQEVGRQVEQQLESGESPFRGVTKTVKAEFRKLVTSSFDGQEVLAEGRAARRRARAQRSATQDDAAAELAIERQRKFREATDFRERAVRLRTQAAAAQQDFREQTAPERQQLRRSLQDIDQGSTATAGRLEAVNAERESLLGQIGAARGAQRQEIKARFTELSTEAQGLEADLKAIQAEFDATVSRIEAIAAQADRLAQRNAQIDALQRRFVEQAQLVRQAEKSVGTPTEQRAFVSEEIEATKRRLEQAGQEQKRILEQRQELIEFGRQQVQRGQDAYALGDQDAFVESGVLVERTKGLIESIDRTFQGLAEARHELERRGQRLQERLKDLPEGLPPVIEEAYRRLGGVLPRPDQVPALRQRSSATIGTASAEYAAAENSLSFREETFRVIQGAKSLADLTEQQLLELFEEVAHSIQFEFGSLDVIMPEVDR